MPGTIAKPSNKGLHIGYSLESPGKLLPQCWRPTHRNSDCIALGILPKVSVFPSPRPPAGVYSRAEESPHWEKGCLVLQAKESSPGR